MSADHDPSKFISYPITELLKLKRREMHIPNLFLRKGVTTIAALSGAGKTTIMFSAGLYAAIGLWGGELIKQRPLFWIAGEDQDGLRAIFEAWCLHNPDRQPDARFMDEAVDFSNDDEVDKLIKHLEELGVVQPLIIADALADILGDLNEDKANDINKIYRNVWRVVNRFDACFVVLHHSGWDERRERGSSAIRAKSDILILIVSFDVEAGSIELKHRRLRGGKPLDQFFLSAKLIPVTGYAQPIPIVTGPLSSQHVLNEPADMDKQHARELVQIMVQHFPQGATNTRLEEQSGMKNSTFKRALACAHKDKGWLVGGGGRGKRYNLNPNGCWKEGGSELGPTSGPVQPPIGGLDPLDPNKVRSNGPDWTQVGPLAPIARSSNPATTDPAKKSNEINETESSIPAKPEDKSGSLLAMTSQAIQHADRKKRGS
jgi:AAA domain